MRIKIQIQIRIRIHILGFDDQKLKSIAICSLVQLANDKVPFHGRQPVPQAFWLLRRKQLYDFRSSKSLRERKPVLQSVRLPTKQVVCVVDPDPVRSEACSSEPRIRIWYDLFWIQIGFLVRNRTFRRHHILLGKYILEGLDVVTMYLCSVISDKSITILSEAYDVCTVRCEFKKLPLIFIFLVLASKSDPTSPDPQH
jgi:hypothetical protein